MQVNRILMLIKLEELDRLRRLDLNKNSYSDLEYSYLMKKRISELKSLLVNEKNDSYIIKYCCENKMKEMVVKW